MTRDLIWNLLPGLVAVILVAAIGLAFRKAKRGNEEFDERQALLRGICFRRAFFTVVLLSALYALIVSLGGPVAKDGVACVLIALVGVGVFAVSCIHADAFFTAKQQPKLYLLISGLCVLSGATGGLSNLREGACLEDGLLTFACLPLVTGALFLWVFLAVLWRVYIRKEAEEE